MRIALIPAVEASGLAGESAAGPGHLRDLVHMCVELNQHCDEIMAQIFGVKRAREFQDPRNSSIVKNVGGIFGGGGEGHDRTVGTWRLVL